MAVSGKWNAYISKHGGIDKIIDKFLPRFIDTIPYATLTIIEGLTYLGIFSPYELENATDETLISIKGVGAAKLKLIRDYFENITKNRHALRLDKV